MKEEKLPFPFLHYTTIAEKGKRAVAYRDAGTFEEKIGKEKIKKRLLQMQVYDETGRAGGVRFTLFIPKKRKDPKTCDAHDLSIWGKRESGLALYLIEESLKFLYEKENVRLVTASVRVKAGDQISQMVLITDPDYDPIKSIYLCMRLGFKLHDYAEMPGGLYLLRLEGNGYKDLVKHGAKKLNRSQCKKIFEQQKAGIDAIVEKRQKKG